MEHGRRYHAFRQGSKSHTTSVSFQTCTNAIKTGYLLPNDEIESDRLDIHHEMILTAMHQKLHLAPLAQDIQRVIDLGTGTGASNVHKTLVTCILIGSRYLGYGFRSVMMVNRNAYLLTFPL